MTEEERIKKRSEEFQKKYGKGQEDAPREAGIEEGDITDYLFPIKGGAKNAIRKIAKRGMAKASTKAKPKKEPETLDYKKIKSQEKSELRDRLGEKQAGTLKYEKTPGDPKTKVTYKKPIKQKTTEEFWAEQAKKQK